MNCFSWEVRSEGLDTVSENDPRARNINRIIDDWVENISQEDRKTFVNGLYDALEADGARNNVRRWHMIDDFATPEFFPDKLRLMNKQKPQNFLLTGMSDLSG